MPRLHKRPFAFWLPAFGLLFLLWSWVDSCHHVTTGYVGYGTGDPFAGGSIILRESRLAFNLDRTSGARPVGRPHRASPYHAGTTRWEIGRNSDTWWFPLPEISSRHESGPSSSIPGRIYESSSHTLSIPHWCLALAYLFFWWLAHRWTRRRLNERQVSAASSLSSPPQPKTGLDLGT